MIAAYFDVDGTLTRTTLLHPLIWRQRAHQTRLRHILWLAGLVIRIPYYLWLDHRSRSDFNRVFFRRYAGLNAAAIAQWHREAFARTVQQRVFPTGLARIEEHRRQGHKIVLLTGGLDFVMRPLAEYLKADDLLCNVLRESNGILTGECSGAPLADEEKRTQVLAHAAKHGIDLPASFAYGNSWGDVPMLEAVGHPVAVNPDHRLARLAKQKGWPIERWRL
jgi:HAD superfamily hydrolase (TIGR01490 family)